MTSDPLLSLKGHSVPKIYSKGPRLLGPNLVIRFTSNATMSDAQIQISDLAVV